MLRKAEAICPVVYIALSVILVFCLIGLSYSQEVHEGVSPTIGKLIERVGKAKPAEVDAVLSSFVEEHRGGFPLIEDTLVTFVYKGAVALRVTVPSDLNGWDTKADQMHQLGDMNLYYLTLVLPLDARIDYKFYVDGMWMLDPLNDDTVSGGFGPNSAFGMPDYVPPPEIEYSDSIPHGKLESHDSNSNIIAGIRKVQVYLPAGYGAAGSGTYPVVFVQDGGEYITLGSMVNVLDYVIAHKMVPPLVAVFINPLDRNYEYFLNADYERMLVEEILPFIRERYDVSTEPGMNAVMGASLGGAISVMISLDRPDVFGKCGSQSGAFEINERRLIKRVADESRKAVDFYLDCGTFSDLTEENRMMEKALKEKGYDVMYHEFHEGHSWGNWRAHIDDMLVFFWGDKTK